MFAIRINHYATAGGDAVGDVNYNAGWRFSGEKSLWRDLTSLFYTLARVI